MTDIGEAVGGIAGLLFAGYVFVVMSRSFDTGIGVDFVAWAAAFVFIAIVLIIALVVTGISTIITDV